MLVLILFLVDSPIIITEVMSNVKGSDAGGGYPGDRNEYVELYNVSDDTIDISLFQLDDLDAIDEICPWEDERILSKYPALRIHTTLFYPHTYALILDREYTSDTTTGGYAQLYDIPDSTLVVTVGNTTIGNGLQSTDPMIIYSDIEQCSTTFGTPLIDDGFPYDPGDGISWERIDLELPDEVSNWHPSIDSAGCTPGRENSTTNAFDLAVDDELIYFIPAVAKVGEDVVIEIIVKNLGLRATSNYEVVVFDDDNCDSTIQSGEIIGEVPGEPVGAFDSISIFCHYQHPGQGIHQIGVYLNFVEDMNLDNNFAFHDLKVVGEVGELALSPLIFTPNNDGIGDRLQIDFRLPEANGLLTISIFNSRGILIHNIKNDELCLEDRGTIYWDGCVNGKKMQSGMYIVYFEYYYQNQVTKAKKHAVLAR